MSRHSSVENGASVAYQEGKLLNENQPIMLNYCFTRQGFAYTALPFTAHHI